MERGMDNGTNGARALTVERNDGVEAAGLSQAIRDLILRFTVTDGDGTLDRSAFSRQPLPPPDAPPQPS
jgi:hypothetical protein